MNTKRRRYEYEPEGRVPNDASIRDLINALGQIYLEAGLPLASAFEAALADYECGFDTRILCQA